jgi:glucose-1-phosphate cytidylyltransferase
MKTVILCGGKGSRLSEETKKIPKPMVKVGKLPILEHIINIYTKFGIKDFIFALGYKKEFIKKYFSQKKFKNLNIKFIDTGLNTLTGKRLKKLEKFLIEEENFFLTYGDGLSDVNLKKLSNFHFKNKKVATVTAVRPPARFGELFINKHKVKKFYEKTQIKSGWINGGFFVFNKKIFDFLSLKDCMLEKEPMTKLVNKKQLLAYKHYSFWQCMDTLRDKELLNKIWKINKNKW